MNAPDLSRLLDSNNPPILLHVLPPEVFEARRIHGSLNACVYETAFLEQIAQLIPDRNAAIVVYGAGGGSLDAKVAAEKLRAAGYANVGVMDDGLDGWMAAGFSCDGNEGPPASPVLDGRFRVDAAASVIRWTGRNLFNQHHGSVHLAGGELCVREGSLESARFTVDMDSIACDDLADAGMNAMLVAHLRTVDFFDVAHFPTAEFVAAAAEPVEGCTEGTPNFLLKGEVTLRGVTQPLEFPVVIASADGRHITGQTQFEIDRTAFGSLYGSGRFFRFLGKHVVNDHIHLDVMIHADREETAN